MKEKTPFEPSENLNKIALVVSGVIFTIVSAAEALRIFLEATKQ